MDAQTIFRIIGLAVALLTLTACAAASAPPPIPTPPVTTTAAPGALTNATAAPTLNLLPDQDPPPGASAEFKTDFTRHTVPYAEIFSGGPPKDGIPAIDTPKFVSVNDADGWLKSNEPVILVEQNGDARAYPLQILIWHEIVNDTVGGVPVVVTFCPLCNTAIAFERTVNGRVLDFGATGRLRYSNLVMYDRQTETWWQQATGEAIAGEMVGEQLNFVPASIIAWSDLKTAHPNAQVLSRETGYKRPYGQNPYVGYDDVNNPPFLYRGPATPDKLKPIARVLTVELNGDAVAYPYDVLQTAPVVNDTVGGKPIVVFWKPGTASALDAGSIANGRDVGAGLAYSRELDNQVLNLKLDGARILDEQTGSEWNLFGQAVNGKLQGKQLTPIVAINHFWFSWAAFKPQTRIYRP
ncbi:MAG: DUF3179 domain-containing protein [Chloroflexi bacterium]|nr:DUF3179 domain-containing protein [Chloroflexota bacterium]